LSEHKVEDEHKVNDEMNEAEIKQDEPNQDASEQEEIQAEEAVTIDSLQAKLAEAEQKAEENYQKYLRAQADFDNFRKRSRKEKEDQAKYASLGLVEQLLPALDNFERAIAASKGTQDAESLAKGVDMVLRQLEQALTSEGVEAITTVGEVFDPTFHQAVMQVESEEYESGTVVEELQKGYKLKDRVIRPAMVKVSS
jgi:molecular chaperone GrpE